MIVSNFPVRLVGAAALACAASMAHAAFTLTTASGAGTAAAYVASFPAGTAALDSFDDLIINSDLGTASLNRAAGVFGYTVSTQTDLQTVQTNGIGGASLTVNGNTDSLTFSNFNWSVYNFGARFFLTDLTYGANAGLMTVRATDVNGLTQDLTFTQSVGSSTNAAVEPIFFKLASGVALQSVELIAPAVGANPNVFATVDNLVLQAVPLPSTWLMMLTGGAFVLRVASRRRV
jgi:hypothetical protein